MDIFDVLIIGGGIIGTSIGRELSRYKLRVGIIEKEEEPAFGVSKSNSGIIHPGTQNPAWSLKGRLCVEGNKLTRRTSRELGVDFKEVGELIVAFRDEDMPELLKIKAEAVKLGVPGLRIVDRAWLKANEPNLSDKALAALYAPTAGIVSPYRLVYALSENAKKNGVEFYTGRKVEGVTVLSSREAPVKYRFEVHTSGGTFLARYLINAAGLFADEISAMAGSGGFEIRPRKGEEFILDKKREYLTNHLLFPMPTKLSKGVLVIRTSDGNPMIGPTAEDVTDKEDLSTTDKGFRAVFSSVREMIPSINENDVIAYFAGLRPVAGDDFIIRLEQKSQGFVNVAGIQSPGLTAAPAIALMVRDILRANGLLLRKKIFFSGKRKKDIHLFSMPVERTKALIKKDRSYGDIVCRCEMVSAKEITDAVRRGARTLDGIKFRTRAQAGRCHGSFCTTRLLKILSEELKEPVTRLTKRGPGSEIIKEARRDA